MSAITTAIQHVIAQLKSEGVSALVNGRVYQGVAPETASHPLVLVQSYGDTSDILAVGKPHAGTTVEVLVRVVGPVDSLTVLEPIHNAVFDALHATNGDYSRGHVASCVRVNETEMTEPTEAGVIRYLGARYRLLVNEQLSA